MVRIEATYLGLDKQVLHVDEGFQIGVGKTAVVGTDGGGGAIRRGGHLDDGMMV